MLISSRTALGFPGCSVVKNLPSYARQAGSEDPLELEMVTHSNILA